MTIATPCIGVCDATRSTACSGCHRTVDQIKAWGKAPTAAKVRFIDNLHNARKLTAEQLGRYSWITSSSTSKRTTGPDTP